MTFLLVLPACYSRGDILLCHATRVRRPASFPIGPLRHQKSDSLGSLTAFTQYTRRPLVFIRCCGRAVMPLPKLDVAGSNPVSRSNRFNHLTGFGPFFRYSVYSIGL
jgi:hypothetical protein